jgi:hypothetical protein
MRPADRILTKHEVRDYVESGDIGAARALIQYAKARRDLWLHRSSWTSKLDADALPSFCLNHH